MASTPQPPSWESILRAGVKAQRLVPGAVAVGGTAASLHARHRVSQDTDHLLPCLRDDFERVRGTLEASGEWKTARVQAPVLILGSLDGVQVGFRQMRRSNPIETITVQTAHGALNVPTLDEMMGMKAYLAYDRNATRDYLDFAALASCATDSHVLESLLKSQERYGGLQSSNVTLEIAKRLSDPKPYDLSEISLAQYKGLVPEWQSWERIASVCRRFGEMLARRLLAE